MKIELTREESQHLIELGVPKEKAGKKNRHFAFGTTALTPNYQGFGAETVTSEIEEYIFKLEDFLNGEILPKELYSETYLDYIGNKTVPDSYGNYELVMRRWYKQWAVCYENEQDWWLCSKIFESEELIDALYKFACWYYGEFLNKTNT